MFGDATLIDDNNNIITRKYKKTESSSFVELYIGSDDYTYVLNKQIVDYRLLLKRNFVPAMSVLCDLEKLKRIDQACYRYAVEDYPLWLAITKTSKMLFVNKTVAYYRIHGNNSIIRDRQKFIREQIKILYCEIHYCAKYGLLGLCIGRMLKLILALLFDRYCNAKT